VWDVDVTELVEVAEIEVGVPMVRVIAAARVPPPVKPFPAVTAVLVSARALSCVWMFDVTPSTKFNSAAVEVTPSWERPLVVFTIVPGVRITFPSGKLTCRVALMPVLTRNV
jgi:hypothetical protein